ncbi:hypothetical protein U3Y39_002658 [Salmonella enterica]|nr:hypothetical protein [Salmonella enterica subsp. enterica serovar Inganda]EKT1295558.1 hypothetical protein [Salmonella enterica]EKT1304581.1 hypothetical protein [Salmonella enterica]EKT1309617.1 hypothetical protein [Salmonella enterica]EKT3008906.1 hypothetical protein [Salmonella enterica]
MEKLTIDQKLQVARMAVDITLDATSNSRLMMHQYHKLTGGKPYVMDIYQCIYTDIIKSITSEPDNI